MHRYSWHANMRDGIRLWVLALVLLLLVPAASGCLPVEEADAPDEPDPVPNDPDGSDEEFEELPDLSDLLDSVHPDEPVEYTLDERFGLGNARRRLQQIRDAGEKIEDHEMQMAWDNWTGALEGALALQEYEIARLRLQLARRQYSAGEIESGELETEEERYSSTRDDFIRFWEDFSIAD